MVKSRMKPKAPRNKKRAQRPRTSQETEVLKGALGMIMDPCGASLKHSAFAGQEGVVQRFSTTYTYSSATELNRIFTWVPGRFRSWSGAGPTGITGLTPAYGGLVPGYNFLTNNAQNARCLAACLDISYLGKELDRSGYVAVGVVPSGTLVTGSLTNTEKLATRLAVKERLPPTDFALKWYPSNADSEYVIPGDPSPGGDDFPMANALTFAALGLPPGAQLVVTLTAIYEWNPKQDIDAVVNSATTVTVPDAVSRINGALASAGRWWTTLGRAGDIAVKTLNTTYKGVSGAAEILGHVSRLALALP